MLTRHLRFLALALLACAMPILAHHGAESIGTPRTPAPGAATVSIHGTVDQIVVQDLVAGISTRYPVLVADDGQRYSLVGPGTDALVKGAPIMVTAKQDGRALFADSMQVTGVGKATPLAAKVGSAQSWTGTLRLIHADNFDGSPSEFYFALDEGGGRITRVELGTLLNVLTNGMRVTIVGKISDSGELVADSIAIVSKPETTVNGAPVQTAATTVNYLVIPVKFPTNAAAPWTYGADPFTAPALSGAVFGPTPTSNVMAYYNEVSYGQHLISGVVADNGSGGFLLANVAKPATCDIGVIASAAEAAATATGRYNVASYTGILYVFNNVGGCGWSGLAYVGWPRAYSNNTTNLLVIAHELGHNFGLAHAASLDCGTNSIGGTCTSAEYGDPFVVMGNNRAMHFNSAQKAELNWIAAGTVATHTTGVATYTLAPIETGGAAHYAVKVPAAANRTYWIEFRQPIGFDAGLSAYPTNGAQIRSAAPFESLCSGCYDDTEFLDMTPTTAAFTDGALVAGQTYTDSIYGVAVNVLSATSSALTVQVTAPGTGTSTITQTSSLTPAAYAANVTFTATVTATGLTGNVNFTEGGAAIAGCGPAPLTGGGNIRTATCTTASIAPGTHSIVAIYAGDATHAASASTALSQVVNKAASSVAIASSLNPSLPGTSVTFTATVTGTASPTGAVNFKDGSTSLTGCGAIALTGSGNTRTAACTAPSLAGGVHSITAVFAGDAINAGSTSAVLSQGVGLASSTTGLASSLNPSMVGNSVTFTATVNGTAPTGAVDFTDGGTSLTGCSAVTLSGSGNTRTATCIAAALGAGAHGIAATYAGDSGNVGSSSGLMTQTVLVISSTVIATSSTPTSLGSVATFTATVAGNAPTGTVAFKDGAAAIANCTMAPLTGSGNSRNAVCNTTGLAIGSHSITAVYSGDGINVGSASTAVTQDVNAASGGAPTLQTAASRKTHGAAGTFDLPLSLVPTNPGTEPRAGPTATVVLTFNKPLTAATVTITEGVATAAAPTFSGNDVVVDLTGVTDQQYVTVALSNVQSADGFTGSGSVRLGFLAGDVNQSRVVSLADLGLVNAAQAQVVNAANFILDINASGTLTVADKAITAGSLTRALPAP